MSAQLEISRDHAPSAIFLVIHEHEQYINWFTVVAFVASIYRSQRFPTPNDACKEPWQALLSPTEATESLRQGSRSCLLLSAANRKWWASNRNDGLLIENGGHLIDNGGHAIENGGHLIENGGHLIEIMGY